MKTHRFKPRKIRALDSDATVRTSASMVTGTVWGGAWAMCVESYQNDAGFSFLGTTVTSLQGLSIGIIAAAFALPTLAFIFHPCRPFWRPLLAALIVAFLAAMLFYAALATLATLLPKIEPSTLEEFLLPFGWSIDNAAMFIALRYVKAKRPSRADHKREEMNGRNLIEPFLFLLLVCGLWLIFFAARSIVSMSVMLTIIPAVVWTVLTFFTEIKREGT